jgi:hypothetical protein
MAFPVNKIGTRHEIKSLVNIYHFFGKKKIPEGEYLRNGNKQNTWLCGCDGLQPTRNFVTLWTVTKTWSIKGERENTM